MSYSTPVPPGRKRIDGRDFITPPPPRTTWRDLSLLQRLVAGLLLGGSFALVFAILAIVGLGLVLTIKELAEAIGLTS